MSQFTPEGFSEHLTRHFTEKGQPAQSRPRAHLDTDPKGRPLLEFLLPNPADPRRSVSLTAAVNRGAVGLCALWFGPVEITGALDPEAAVPAIREILAGNLVCIARYKSRSSYNDRRGATGQWVYQLPDDAAALAAMQARLRTPASRLQRLLGRETGVYEVFSWSEGETIER